MRVDCSRCYRGLPQVINDLGNSLDGYFLQVIPFYHNTLEGAWGALWSALRCQSQHWQKKRPTCSESKKRAEGNSSGCSFRSKSSRKLLLTGSEEENVWLHTHTRQQKTHTEKMFDGVVLVFPAEIILNFAKEGGLYAGCLCFVCSQNDSRGKN